MADSQATRICIDPETRNYLLDASNRAKVAVNSLAVLLKEMTSSQAASPQTQRLVALADQYRRFAADFDTECRDTFDDDTFPDNVIAVMSARRDRRGGGHAA